MNQKQKLTAEEILRAKYKEIGHYNMDDSHRIAAMEEYAEQFKLPDNTIVSDGFEGIFEREREKIKHASLYMNFSSHDVCSILYRLESEYRKLQQQEEDFLLHFADVVSCHVAETNNFLSTETRNMLIQLAKETFNSASSVQDRQKGDLDV